MQDGVAQRPITRAQRGFGPEQLAILDRDQVRQLCHALLLAEGVAIDDYRTQADFDEFTVNAPSIWHTRRVVVRIYHRAVVQEDLDDTLSFALATGAVEALVLPIIQSNGVDPPNGVVLIPPNATADRITSSALARWNEDRPQVAIDRLELSLQLADSALLDPVGIQWLPPLSLNELPTALLDMQVEPQDLFERKTFRLMSATFQFGGVRYGEAVRGKALPDSVLYWPDGSGIAAIVDCKAASSGYTMSSDHLLRFVNYWEKLSPELTSQGFELWYAVIVSSYFPGAPGARHPFYNRSEQIREKTGLELVYVMASDLARAALQTEALDRSLADRTQFDWHTLFRHGLVTPDQFDDLLSKPPP